MEIWRIWKFRSEARTECSRRDVRPAPNLSDLMNQDLGFYQCCILTVLLKTLEGPNKSGHGSCQGSPIIIHGKGAVLELKWQNWKGSQRSLFSTDSRWSIQNKVLHLALNHRYPSWRRWQAWVDAGKEKERRQASNGWNKQTIMFDMEVIMDRE